MMTPIIACDVFADELRAAGAKPEQVRWLPMGLHDQPGTLRTTLQSAIDEIESADRPEHIILAYGLCGNGLLGLKARHASLIVPRAHDCITILLGGAERHCQTLREHPGTYFYSPGWIRGKRVPGPDREQYLKELYGPRCGGDEELLEDLIDADRETFAHHNRAAYVDITADSGAEAYCRSCARHLGWEFRRLKGDPSFLRALLDGPWDDASFLSTGPGQEIALDETGVLTARDPA